MIASALERLLRLVYPERCRVCGGGLEHGRRFFCDDCLLDMTPVEDPHCSVCGRPFPGGAGGVHQCRDCMKKPPPFDMARALVFYDGVVAEAIRLFKYRPVRGLGGYLAPFVEQGAACWFADAAVAAAVPLHPKRLRSRGFNQSLVLADAAARKLGIALSLDGLVRTRHTRPQVSLGPAEREANVKGAFAVPRPQEFLGKSVLLVDDVFTTGATVRECARVLKGAGALKVYVLTVARGE